MHRLALLLFLATALPAAERWVEFRSGPFEVVTNAGADAGRERLLRLEQFRFGVEQILGASELRPVWPVRIVVSKSVPETVPALARDAYTGAVPPEGALSRATQRAIARILIESGEGRLPEDMEQGLADVFSTMEFKGRQTILGAPLPQAERNRNWAKMHMLTVPADYFGRLRTLVFNLSRGVDPGPAYRNAFSKSPAEIEKEADAYLQAGNFTTTQLRRRPILPEKEFKEQPVDAARVPVLLADAARNRAAYETLLKASPSSPEALEGLGLYARAVQASSTSARAWLDYARREPDRAKAVTALERAARLNPRWAAPLVEMARLEENVERRGLLLDKAAKLASESREERERLLTIRAEAEVRRKEQEAAEKKRQAEEEKRAIEELRQKSLASIQAALDKANREHPAMQPSSGKVEPWWEGPRPDARVEGMLRQFDCLGKQARLVIETPDKKLLWLLVPDPAKLDVTGGEKNIACGAQRPARRVTVRYFSKPDAKSGTAGEAAVLEFP